MKFAAPVVALLGPRQCGKTTLARFFVENIDSDNAQVQYFDLDKATDLRRFGNPEVMLSELSGWLAGSDSVYRTPSLQL